MIEVEPQTLAVKPVTFIDSRAPRAIGAPPRPVIMPASRFVGEPDFDDDGLRPSTGIAVAILISSLFWVPVIYALF
jgi:hypothetical protein